MNNAAQHSNPEVPPPLPVAEIAARLDVILAQLLLVVAAHFRVLGIMTNPLWSRISRARQRFARLLALLAAGKSARRPAAPSPHRPRAAPAPASAYTGAAIGAGPIPPMSRRFAWVITRIGYQATGFASQLNHLLQQPGVAATLAASPGTTRSLRPLCRILGIELPPALRLPARPPRPAAPRRATPRPAPPPAPKGTPDRPLPAYVRAAVRAWKRRPLKFA